MPDFFFGPGKLPLKSEWKLDINSRTVVVGLRNLAGVSPDLVCLTSERFMFPFSPNDRFEFSTRSTKGTAAGEISFEFDVTRLRNSLVESPLYLRAFDAARQPIGSAVRLVTTASSGGLSNEAALNLKFERVPECVVVPMKKKYGGPGTAHGMFKPRGLAVHTTAGRVSNMGDLGNRWDAGTGQPASAHFGIAIDGTLYQYIALSYRGFAIDGNTIVDNYWYSVEIESGWVDKDGKAFVHAPDGKNHRPEFRQPKLPSDHIEEWTNPQLASCAKLFAWLASRFEFPVWKAAMGKNNDGEGRGLSCHRWLDIARGKPPGKHCPGDLNIDLMYDIVSAAQNGDW